MNCPRLTWFAVACLLLALASRADAASTWELQSSPYSPSCNNVSLGAVVSCVAARVMAVAGPGPCTWGSGVITDGPYVLSVGPPKVWEVQIGVERVGGGSCTTVGGASYRLVESCTTPPINFDDGTCTYPPPEECSGLASEGVGESFTSSVTPSNPAGYCNPVSHCLMAVVSHVSVEGSTVYSITHTAEQCPVPAPSAPSEDDLDEGETCIEGSGGTFCLTPQGENCGYLNDGYVCLPTIEDDGCKVFGDGGRVCGASAPVPPRPDNGTPSVPAAPDEQVSTTNNTYNYYNSSTVANSSRDAGTSGDNPQDGDDGDGAGNGMGDCEGEECGEGGSAGGGEDCDAPPTCDGDPIMCAVLNQEWRNRCDQEIEAAGDMPAAVGLPGDGELGNGVPFEEVEGPESFDASGFLSETCPADVNIDLDSYGVVSVPLSDLCEILRLFGFAIMAVAYFLAARIVFGGF